MRKTSLFIVCFLLVVFTANASAGEIGIPNRIGNASPGEWVSYNFGNGMYRKFAVSGFEVKDGVRYVTIKSYTLMNKAVIQEDETIRPVSDSNVLLEKYAGADLTQRNETIDVHGEQMDCTVVSGRQDGVLFAIYLSESIPVFGLARFDVMGEKLFEVHEFGSGDEKVK